MRELKNGLQERSVMVETKELLETLEKNREKHQADYQVAMKGYRKHVLAKLKKSKEKGQRMS